MFFPKEIKGITDMAFLLPLSFLGLRGELPDGTMIILYLYVLRYNDYGITSLD